MTTSVRMPVIASLMIVTPPVVDAAAFAPLLDRALAGGLVAAVHLRMAPMDERAHINLIKQLAPVAQRRNVALVAETPPGIAIRGGADGAHIAIRSPGDVAGLADARAQLDSGRILGIGGLKSRHDAMEAGEAGVDYVMFGEPRADGSILPLPTVIERASWWAEIFQTPCVAYAPAAEAVVPLAGTGAEFVALGDWIFASGTEPAKAIAAAHEAIAALARSSAPG